MLDSKILQSKPTDIALELIAQLQRDLKGQRDSSAADKILDDDFFFARDVLGNHPVFPQTLDSCKDWKTLFTSIYALGRKAKRIVICAPRNSYKTTILASKVVNLIVRDRNIRIAYFTNVFDNAVQFGAAVRRQLEANEILLDAFGKFKPEGSEDELNGKASETRKAWRQDYFFVSGRSTNAKEPTLTIAAIGKTKVGQHYDIIICDDCVDNDNTKTPDAVKDTITWFKLISSLCDKASHYGPGGCIADCGTRYTDGDLHGWLLGETDDEASPWRTYSSIVLRAIENPKWDPVNRRFVKPALNFPFVLTADLLAEERQNGPYVFNSQYQNDPISEDAQIFRLSWIVMVRDYDVPRDLRNYILADYAYEIEDANDRTAIWVVGLDWERKAYCLDLSVGRWTLNDRCLRTVSLARKYDVECIALEEITANEGVFAELKRLRNEYRLKFRIQPIAGRSEQSKFRRILGLQPRFEGGRIFFLERDPKDWMGIPPELMRIGPDGEVTGDAVYELTRFPKARHDDIPDALSDIDKMDPERKVYLFTGASARNHDRLAYKAAPSYSDAPGPRLASGRILYQEASPHDPRQTTENFWSKHADALRQNTGAGQTLWPPRLPPTTGR
uniref:Putative structural protein n=1 Tax=viral metagenome TaxID=1070528 RepID=A0A6H1ZG68_9ZZZZ